MKDQLEKLMGKRSSDAPLLSENKKAAKMSILEQLHNEMSDMMGDELKNMHQATVSASSPASLKEGLKKAEELISQHEKSDEPLAEEQDEHDQEGMGQLAKEENPGNELNASEAEEAAESPEEEAKEEKSGLELSDADKADIMKEHARMSKKRR